jgi:hypothetical protein
VLLPDPRLPRGERRSSGFAATRRLRALLADAPELAARLAAVRSFALSVRASEYHVTNSCNIRCKGCWFFEHDFDQNTHDQRDLVLLREFVESERRRGVNTALLIGGEPTLVPDRIATYAELMPNVTISSNGLRPLSRTDFPETTVAVSLFGGGGLDDELRAIRPNGTRFSGLLDKALANYRDDARAGFIFALTELGVDYVEETVKRIADNGNRVHFNFYSAYDSDDPLRVADGQRLLDKALEVRERYPDTVASHPYYIQVMMSGRTEWGEFSYEVCPSISVTHPAHTSRIQNGNPVLPGFVTWAPDLETVHFCCTSGHCSDCRDSQAVFSWLLVSLDKFLNSTEQLTTWVEVAESYWGQFYWSPFHPARRRETPAASPPAGT